MSKLAIVIPYYKIDFFEQTLKSVASQTNKNFVLYIGNDASPENPQPIIQKYFDAKEYKYYNYTENVGGKNLVLQWERILENVEEDWFQILGDDDVLADNFVEEFYKSVNYCDSHKIYCMKTIHHHIDDNNEMIKINDYNTETIEAKKFFTDKYFRVVSSSLSENIFKTEKYQKYRFEKIPLAWGSDDLAILRFSEYKTIYYNRNTYVKVRISESSISGSQELESTKNNAYNVLREKFLINHSKYFGVDFIKIVAADYLLHCFREKKRANFCVVSGMIKKLHVVSVAKLIKKIHYVNTHIA